MSRITMLAVVCLSVSSAPAGPPVTFESLLKEMVDRDAAARWPDPAYTGRQFSSYDRASKTAQDEKGWFANGDRNHYLRVEETNDRKEWVMMDAEGPGAVVRVWSANPEGTLRVYLDGSAKPVIEAKMDDLLGGKWAVGALTVGTPLAGKRSKGWNLYLPIPYSTRCKITSDRDGSYYQVNYRTYGAGTEVDTFEPGALTHAADLLKSVQEELGGAPKRLEYHKHDAVEITAGQSHSFPLALGQPGALAGLQIDLNALDLEQALRSTVVRMEFDGAETVWCPLGDFFGCGVGKNQFRTWFTGISGSGLLACRWVMPFERSARVTLENFGKAPIRAQVYTRLKDWTWDERSMHFHATWRHEYPIHVYGERGTRDFNYVQIQGRGVYVGDVLAVMNPVAEWWGEGDEKISVDGEAFPSHFGTGTEDYYGYGWCDTEPFSHPFHAQARCDGHSQGNNWGHTTLTRVRALDAIPFESSLKVDMELWHWKECDVAYAATTYFYARLGVTTNRKPQPQEAGREVPRAPALPPPFRMDGAIECEGMKVLSRPGTVSVEKQNMRSFARGHWSGESQLWVHAQKPGDFIELAVPVSGTNGKPVRATLYATKSWDYGIVRFTVNGQKAGPDVDLFSGQPNKCVPSGPIELGTFTPKNGQLTLRAEVVGANASAAGTKSFLGLDCVVLTPAP